MVHDGCSAGPSEPVMLLCLFFVFASLPQTQIYITFTLLHSTKPLQCFQKFNCACEQNHFFCYVWATKCVRLEKKTLKLEGIHRVQISNRPVLYANLQVQLPCMSRHISKTLRKRSPNIVVPSWRLIVVCAGWKIWNSRLILEKSYLWWLITYLPAACVSTVMFEMLCFLYVQSQPGS